MGGTGLIINGIANSFEMAFFLGRLFLHPPFFLELWDLTLLAIAWFM